MPQISNSVLPYKFVLAQPKVSEVFDYHKIHIQTKFKVVLKIQNFLYMYIMRETDLGKNVL